MSFKKTMLLIVLVMQLQGGTENGRRRWKYRGKSMNQIEAEEIN